MVKVTFQTPQETYWAVCMSVRYDELEGHDLDGVLEDSGGNGPSTITTVSPKWQIIQMEAAEQDVTQSSSPAPLAAAGSCVTRGRKRSVDKKP